MSHPLPFLAKPRSPELYGQFPRCTANSRFPVESVIYRDGQLYVQLRTAPLSSVWLELDKVELIAPAVCLQAV